MNRTYDRHSGIKTLNDLWSRCETQHVIFKMQKIAAIKIQAAFRGWIWRKNVFWNPHTTIGQKRLYSTARQFCFAK